VDGRNSNNIWDWVDKIFDLSLCCTHVSLLLQHVLLFGMVVYNVRV
jgi:hypothetical protein